MVIIRGLVDVLVRQHRFQLGRNSERLDFLGGLAAGGRRKFIRQRREPIGQGLVVVSSGVEEDLGAKDHLHPFPQQPGDLHVLVVQPDEGDVRRGVLLKVSADVVEKLFDVRVAPAKSDDEQLLKAEQVVQQAHEGAVGVGPPVIVQGEDDGVGAVVATVGVEHQAFVVFPVEDTPGFFLVPEKIGGGGLGIERGAGVGQAGVVVERQIVVEGQAQQGLVRLRVGAARLGRPRAPLQPSSCREPTSRS